MAVSAEALQSKFSTGAALSATFSLFFGRLGFFLPSAVLFLLPAAAFRYLAPPISDYGLDWGLFVAGVLLEVFCLSLMTAVFAYAVVMQLQGRPVTIGGAIAKGLQRYIPVAVASLIAGILITIGLMLFIVPGYMIMTVLWVIVPVIVVEGAGPIESFNRSSTLTRERRWAIFGTVIVLGLIEVVVSEVYERVIMPGLLADDLVGEVFVIGTLISAPFYALGTIAAAYGYFHLKIDKEGADLDELARTFA